MPVKMFRSTFMIFCFMINICYIENAKELYLGDKELSSFYKGANRYTYYYSDKVHLMSSQTPFDVFIEFWSEGIRCWSHLYGKEFFSRDYRQTNNKMIYRPAANVVKDMSSSWNCSIKNIYKGRHYTYDIYFRVRIKDLEPPQIILINRLVLDTRRDIPFAEDDQVYVTEYNYAENDTVDVACIIQQQDCEVLMNYDYAESRDDSFGNITSKNVVGFRVKLQEKHNNSRMICACTCKDEKVQVEVVFIMQNSFRDNIMNLKINGTTVRGKLTNGDKEGNKIIYLNYAYFHNDHPSIHAMCHTNRDGITLNWSGHNYLMAGTKVEGESLIQTNFQFNKASKIKFVASNTSNLYIKEQIIIVLTPMSLNESAGLSMNLPKENILMEAYTLRQEGWTGIKDTRIFYEFNDGDILPLKCLKMNSSLAATLDFNGTETNETFVTKILKLRSIDNDTSLKCVLRSRKEERLFGRSHVVFRMKKIEISDSKFSDTLIWIVIICILVIVIAILVAILIIYKKKYDRLRQAKTSNDYENVKRNVETSVPANSNQQELIYAVLDLHNSNITPKKQNIDTIYATVVPEIQGQYSGVENIYANQEDMAIYSNTVGRNVNPDVINVDTVYATANDLKISVNPNVEDNYAEVIPNRKINFNVTNDSRYVNSASHKYVKPSSSKR